jgi:hypothetical protein
VRASEYAQALEVDDADGGIGGVVFGEPHDLLGHAPGNSRRSDNCQRCGTPTGRARSLEHSLGQERHETIAPTLGTHLHLNDVRYPALSGEQVRLKGTVMRLALDAPAAVLEGRSQDGFGEFFPSGSDVFPEQCRAFHNRRTRRGASMS